MARRADLTPEQRAMRARIGAHQSWANTADRKARVAPARRGFMERFEKQVDPDGVLDPAERRRRADSALKAHMTQLALKSVKSRARKRAS